MAITIQNNFEKVASHKTPQFKKDNLVQETIARFFVNRNAIVQTTSLSRQVSQTETVGDYLTRLAGMSTTLIMGCYGIGVSRLVAATIEQKIIKMVL
uniref:hypothetical protein n=1 Tax=Candidatus Marithrix sp. Canyon 246 TaxID=1827136 RepID=UPI001C0AE508